MFYFLIGLTISDWEFRLTENYVDQDLKYSNDIVYPQTKELKDIKSREEAIKQLTDYLLNVSLYGQDPIKIAKQIAKSNAFSGSYKKIDSEVRTKLDRIFKMQYYIVVAKADSTGRIKCITGELNVKSEVRVEKLQSVEVRQTGYIGIWKFYLGHWKHHHYDTVVTKPTKEDLQSINKYLDSKAKDKLNLLKYSLKAQVVF